MWAAGAPTVAVAAAAVAADAAAAAASTGAVAPAAVVFVVVAAAAAAPYGGPTAAPRAQRKRTRALATGRRSQVWTHKILDCSCEGNGKGGSKAHTEVMSSLTEHTPRI